MENKPQLYGVYKCEAFSQGRDIQLADLRPVRLSDEGKEGQTKTVSIYAHEAEIMNNGVGLAPKWLAASRNNLVYLTADEFIELTGEVDKHFPHVEKPKKGRPKKEETKSE